MNVLHAVVILYVRYIAVKRRKAPQFCPMFQCSLVPTAHTVVTFEDQLFKFSTIHSALSVIISSFLISINNYRISLTHYGGTRSKGSVSLKQVSNTLSTACLASDSVMSWTHRRDLLALSRTHACKETPKLI